jgi:heat-inducible transcriptional repressor
LKTLTTDPSTLSERSLFLFKSLVEHFIMDGQPVGSRTLARDIGSDLSPATIRNVMADLEDLGLLMAPHTSAGRIPTARGYRLFVDTLLRVDKLDDKHAARIARELEKGKDVHLLLEKTSEMLSEITSLAGIVMLPHTNRTYTAAELQQAANYLNAMYSGKDLQRVRQEILAELHKMREDVNSSMQFAIEMAQKAFAQDPQMPRGDYLLSGHTNLMNVAELSNLEKLKKLFDSFNQKRDILHLLEQAINAEGVQIFIGEESGYEVLGDCSVVTSPYEVDGQILGVLGVLGPTRMNYERVIPVVDITAKMLGMALNSSS